MLKHGIFFAVVILTIQRVCARGGKCHNNAPTRLKDANEITCHPGQYKLHCTPFNGYRYTPCSKWCKKLFARKEMQECSAKFRALSTFKIRIASKPCNITVKPCWPFRKGSFLVIIRDPKSRHVTPTIVNISEGPTEEDNDSALHLSEKLMVNFFTSIGKIDVGEENALQNVSSLLENTIQNFKNASSRDEYVNITTDDEFKANAHFTTMVFEDFVARFAQQQLNDTVPQRDVREQLDLQVRRVFNQDEKEFFLNDTKGGNSISISAENIGKNDSVVLGVMYKDLHDIFMANQTKPNATKENRWLNTRIMSAAIYPPTEILKKDITLVFKNIKPAGKKRECVFWNYNDSSEGWSGEGCYVKSITSSQTVCVCNHLTHFAVLMDFTDDADASELPPHEMEILTILTYVGVALSLMGAVLTIICYLLLTDKHAPLSQIRVSLVASLAAGQITFLAGIDATDNKGACVAAAALMQYFFMAAFCWMLVEGIYLYLVVVKVYNVSYKMALQHGMSWGIPAVLVAISLSIAAAKDGVNTFVSDKNCWLSSSNGLIWIFVTFVLFIELVNLVILVRVIREMASMQHTQDKQTEQIRLSIRACVVLIPLLGITWLFGILSPLHKAFVYISVILNSTQGLFIFVLHCARNSEIRARFKRRIRKIGPAEENSTVRVNKTSQTNQSTANEVDPSDVFELQD